MIETINVKYKQETKLSLFQSFQEVSGLGADIPIVLTAKAEQGGSYRRARYQEQQKAIREGRVFKKLRKSLSGFIRFGKLASILGGDNTHPLNQDGIEPYDFISRGSQGLFAFHDDTRIRVVDLATGTLEKTITHVFRNGEKMELYNIHTLEYHPTDPNLILISITGLDRVVEVNIETLEVLWEWCPWHHGMATNEHGLTMMDKGGVLPACAKGKAVEYLSFEEAKRRIDAIMRPSSEEAWIHQVNMSNLPVRLGLNIWERVKIVNTAFYAQGGDKITLTFWQTGEAVCIDRYSKEMTLVAQDLGACPHSLIPVGDSYYLSDTYGGRILQYDSKFQQTCEIDFTDSPLPTETAEIEPEWIQNTHPIAENLLATIDFRRSRVVVWNFQERIYTAYPVSDEWVLQSLKSIDPSSLDVLGFGR